MCVCVCVCVCVRVRVCLKERKNERKKEKIYTRNGGIRGERYKKCLLLIIKNV